MATYAAGDRRAWDPLFDRLAPRLLGFFQRSLPDPAAAEGHVEATFVQLHRSRHSYRLGTSVRHWVFGIAARVVIDGENALERRARRGAVRAPARAQGASGESARDRQVRQALEGLAITERMAIHLHRVERMTLEEIADVLGWTEDAVRCQLLHAYRALRERLWTLGDDGVGP
jgi:RNA polymerase sigma-70 factor, ECF subfamily